MVSRRLSNYINISHQKTIGIYITCTLEKDKLHGILEQTHESNVFPMLNINKRSVNLLNTF